MNGRISRIGRALARLVLTIATMVSTMTAQGEYKWMDDVKISNGETVTLKDNNGNSFPYNSTANRSTTNADVATVVNANGNVAVKCWTGSGKAEVTFTYNSDTYHFDVLVMGDIQVSEEVRLSHGQTMVLKDNNGNPIPWKNYGQTRTTDNSGVATITSVDGNVAVNNPTHDGVANVTISSGDNNYHFVVRVMTVEVQKTILSASESDPNNLSNATIRVTTHVLPGYHAKVNNVLYISSRCMSHGLTKQVVSSAMTAVAQKANVDYVFVSMDLPGDCSGHLEIGQTFSTSQVPDLDNEECGNLQEFLDNLDAKLDDNHENYDYVILSFDCGLLCLEEDYGHLASWNSTQYERVANKLRWYYENNRVIWLRPPMPKDADTLATLAFYEGQDEFYRPSDQYMPIDPCYTPEMQCESIEKWRAFLAVVDPATCLDTDYGYEKECTIRVWYHIDQWGNWYYDDTLGETLTDWFFFGNPNELQVAYDNPSAVADYLSFAIDSSVHDLEIEDTILNLNNSLSIVQGAGGAKVRFYTWAGEDDPRNLVTPGQVIADLPNDDQHWKAEPASSYTVNGYKVKATLPSVMGERWNKFEIEVVDNGTFLAECLKHNPPLATLDPETGKYIVNPNDGPAKATLYAYKDGVKIPAVAESDAPMNRRWAQDSKVVALWITDHADAGANHVHLQFEPVFNAPPMSFMGWANSISDQIWLFSTDTPAGLDVVTVADSVHAKKGTIRNISNAIDEGKKRIWITVPVPAENKVKKIVIPKRFSSSR